MPVPVSSVTATVDVTRTNPVVQATARPLGVTVQVGTAQAQTQKAELKAIAAASADFADFQTRMAAW